MSAMLTAPPVDFFLFLASVYKVNNPILIVTEGEETPSKFCSGHSLAAMCLQYAPSEPTDIASYLLEIQGRKSIYI